MKKLLLAFTLVLGAFIASAQYPQVTIEQIKTVSQMDLQNCEDDPQFLGDTVTVVGVMLHDGNLSDVQSSSVQGDHRPQVFIRDTSNNAAAGPFRTILLQGVYTDAQGNALPVTAVNDLFAGDIIKVTGIVNEFRGQVQLDILSPDDITTIDVLSGNLPAPTKVQVGELNDENRENILPTGEKYEGDVVTIENVEVIAVDRFSGRVNFDVQDSEGNVVNIYDLFVVQKAEGLPTANPKSPLTEGTFVAPEIGTIYESITGIVQHEENGCASSANFRRGYRINPFLPSHYVKGATPPSITNLMHTPGLPNASSNVNVTLTATDGDGTIASVKLFYALNGGAATEVAMTLVGGSTEDYQVNIGSFAEGSLVSYYAVAEDNEGNLTRFPKEPALAYFHVKANGLGIFEIQQTVFEGQNASGYVGQTVTVTGVATATLADNDLGYVYIQDPNFSRFAGIQLSKNPNLSGIKRNDQVTVTGVVAENAFGGSDFTVIEVSSFNVTGTGAPIQPVYFDPSLQNAEQGINMEEYEGMLVALASQSGAPMVIGNPNFGFGEFGVATSASEEEEDNFRVLTARTGNFANSSLWVNILTEARYLTNDGEVKVSPTFLTSEIASIDTLTGILYESFDTYKLTPRNNADVKNAVVSSIFELDNSLSISVYPNPASDFVNIEMDKDAKVLVRDLSGKIIRETNSKQGFAKIQLLDLEPGVYFGTVVSSNNNAASFKIIKK